MVRQLEPALFLHERACKSAFFMPEQFALHQPGRYGGTVESDESALATRAKVMNRPC